MLSLAQLLTLTMSSQALDVSTTSRGAEGLVLHSGLYSTQNSTQPIGGRVGSPTATKAIRSFDPPPAPSEPVRSPAEAAPVVVTAKAAVTTKTSAVPVRSIRLKCPPIVWPLPLVRDHNSHKVFARLISLVSAFETN